MAQKEDLFTGESGINKGVDVAVDQFWFQERDQATRLEFVADEEWCHRNSYEKRAWDLL